MRIGKTARNVGLGYLGFCVVNWAATYYGARSGSPFLLGSARLMQLNESLRPFNLLSRIIDPITTAERNAGSSAAPASPATFLPAPPPVVTNQSSGTTTYFGP
jgi:hypothetical protein